LAEEAKRGLSVSLHTNTHEPLHEGTKREKGGDGIRRRRNVRQEGWDQKKIYNPFSCLQFTHSSLKSQSG